MYHDAFYEGHGRKCPSTLRMGPKNAVFATQLRKLQKKGKKIPDRLSITANAAAI